MGAHAIGLYRLVLEGWALIRSGRERSRRFKDGTSLVDLCSQVMWVRNAAGSRPFTRI